MTDQDWPILTNWLNHWSIDWPKDIIDQMTNWPKDKLTNHMADQNQPTKTTLTDHDQVPEKTSLDWLTSTDQYWPTAWPTDEKTIIDQLVKWPIDQPPDWPRITTKDHITRLTNQDWPILTKWLTYWSINWPNGKKPLLINWPTGQMTKTNQLRPHYWTDWPKLTNIDQLTIWPFDWSNGPKALLINLPTAQKTNWPNTWIGLTNINQLTKPLIYWLTKKPLLIKWLIGYRTSWPPTWLTKTKPTETTLLDWLTKTDQYWPTDWPTDQLTIWLTKWLKSHYWLIMVS